MRDNGGSLTEEQEPLDQSKEEALPFPTQLDLSSTWTDQLLLDNGNLKPIRELLSGEDLQETLEMFLDGASMSTVIPTLTTDTLSGTDATMVSTKPGTLTKKEFHSQDTHLEMDSDSKSNPSWPKTELSDTSSTSVVINIDLESRTTTHTTTNSGGSLTGEPDLSEPSLTEEWLSQSKMVETTGALHMPLSSDTLETNHYKKSDGSLVAEEISEILEEDALMSLEVMSINDTLPGTHATTVPTKDG